MIRDFKGKILIDTLFTFGGVAGCRSFGGPADAWKELMQKKFKFLNMFRWFDDNLFIRKAHDVRKISMEAVVSASAELGVKTNTGKYREFDIQQKYIGFIWHGRDRNVSIPDEKRIKRISQIGSYLLW